MPTYLHDPALEPTTIARLVRARQRETSTLDFKADWWADKKDKQTGFITIPAAEELASDVAAFLNADGGDLILGVTEDEHGCAAGWYPAARASFRGRTEQVYAILNERLEPRDSARNVHVFECEVEEQDGLHPVMVIAVAPWADGPVGVVRRSQAGGSARGQRLYTLFPMRDQTDTRYLTLSEATVAMDRRARTAYLKLRQLLQGNRRRSVFFCGPVEASIPGLDTFEIHGALHHGWLVDAPSLHDAAIEMSLTNQVYGVAVETLAQRIFADMMKGQAAGRYSSGYLPPPILDQAAENLERAFPRAAANPMLRVPLSQVVDVWDTGNPSDPIQMLLSLRVVFVGARWGLSIERRQ